MTINIDALHMAVILDSFLYSFGVIYFSLVILLLLIDIVLCLYIAFLKG